MLSALLEPGSLCLHSNALTTRLQPTYFLPFAGVSDSGFSCAASYMCKVLRTLPAPWAPPPVPSLQRHCRPLAHAWPWPSASGPRRLRVRGSVRAELRTSPEVKRREIGLLLRWKKQISVPARCGASAPARQRCASPYQRAGHRTPPGSASGSLYIRTELRRMGIT